MKYLRLALAQINSTVGDLSGNAQLIISFIKQARRQKADVIAFPELALTGYPPEDLLLKPQFITDNLSEIQRISRAAEGIAAIVGFVDRRKDNSIYNAAAVIAGKKIIDVYHKVLLPNYGVFDEFRYFRAGSRFPVYKIKNMNIGLNICEDIWHRDGPARFQSSAGAEIIININASPYERGKPEVREKLLHERSSENGVLIAYLNAVGGQDELVFDGFSMVYDHKGRLIARAKQFAEDIMVLDLDLAEAGKYKKTNALRAGKHPVRIPRAGRKIRVPVQDHTARKFSPLPAVEPLKKKEEEIYRALVLGTKDYITKNGFRGAVVGLSGGVDSSLVAAIAVDAVGKGNVKGLFMPSRYTSKESREDAFLLAGNLGIDIIEIPIGRILAGYLKELEESFRGKGEDTTEENLQARIRGNLLMAFSNKFGWIVLTTGNKSEMSVGYATLYGDMAGGFAVIKDVPKTLVYDICRWKNTAGGSPLIPERVLWKEPTAELKPDQKDRDTLPPYEVLDPILKAYIEEHKSFRDVLDVGCGKECTKRVIAMVDRSEYKRRQSPPGIKITARAFGRDRRFPITNKYRSY